MLAKFAFQDVKCFTNMLDMSRCEFRTLLGLNILWHNYNTYLLATDATFLIISKATYSDWQMPKNYAALKFGRQDVKYLKQIKVDKSFDEVCFELNENPEEGNIVQVTCRYIYNTAKCSRDMVLVKELSHDGENFVNPVFRTINKVTRSLIKRKKASTPTAFYGDVIENISTLVKHYGSGLQFYFKSGGFPLICIPKADALYMAMPAGHAIAKLEDDKNASETEEIRALINAIITTSTKQDKQP
ncbi:MAG: hypothetical protein KatS3mg087_1167 [Patescibacteria group bacterium]|nr:MAG: hypothetical protein KatS3mg087_1167 [Patescibacteria group bacterium]